MPSLWSFCELCTCSHFKRPIICFVANQEKSVMFPNSTHLLHCSLQQNRTDKSVCRIPCASNLCSLPLATVRIIVVSFSPCRPTSAMHTHISTPRRPPDDQHGRRGHHHSVQLLEHKNGKYTFRKISLQKAPSILLEFLNENECKQGKSLWDGKFKGGLDYETVTKSLHTGPKNYSHTSSTRETSILTSFVSGRT